MASSMTMALVLSAVDKMGPSLKSAEERLKSYKRHADSMKNMEITVNIKEIKETVQKLKNDAVQKADELRAGGMKDVAEGTAAMLPVTSALKEFGTLEQSMINYKIATYDSSKSAEEMAANLKKAEEEAMKLGDATKYNTAESLNAFEVLAKGGIGEDVILSGLGKGSIYLAQLENLSPERTADALSKVYNAFGKSGDEMYQFADHMSRASDATNVSVASLSAALPYAAGKAATLGQSAEDATTAMALLYNTLGDQTGTAYNAFLTGLVPTTKGQIEAMEELNLLDANGRSKFMNEDGTKLREMNEIIPLLRETFKDMRADDVTTYASKIWNERGARAISPLINQGQGSWEDIGEQMRRGMSLDDKVALQNTGLVAKAENVGGSFSNLMATAGRTMGDDVKGPLDTVQDILNAARLWIEANPKVAQGLLQILMLMGSMRIGMGILKLLGAFVLGFGGNVLTVVGWLLGFVGGLQNLYLAFTIARKGGFGFFRSIWEGVKLAWPWIGKLSAFLWRFVGQWLVMAARIAFGWLVALGPVGIIIAVVTAIIAAAVWAWNTNFMGFRDKCTAAWEAIGRAVERFKGVFSNVYNSVAGWINGLIEKFGPLIRAAKEFLGLSEKAGKTPPPKPLPGGNGGGGNSMTQTNHVSVNSPQEAAEYVERTVPSRYTDSRDIK
jgi:phage tail tape measure protein, TP901 family, core region